VIRWSTMPQAAGSRRGSEGLTLAPQQVDLQLHDVAGPREGLVRSNAGGGAVLMTPPGRRAMNWLRYPDRVWHADRTVRRAAPVSGNSRNGSSRSDTRASLDDARRSMVGGMPTPHQVPESGLGRFPGDLFGMFVHRVRYSPIGAGGWGMFRERYLIDENERIVDRYEATAFGAGSFVGPVWNTGRRHLTITSRRDDGMSTYDPSLSDDKLTKAAGCRDGFVSTVRLELS
jgi:hypothetical protein